MYIYLNMCMYVYNIYMDAYNIYIYIYVCMCVYISLNISTSIYSRFIRLSLFPQNPTFYKQNVTIL